jgi:hypothetical protein
MDSFAALIAPMAPETFFAEYYGRKPVHIRATDRARAGLMP